MAFFIPHSCFFLVFVLSSMLCYLFFVPFLFVLAFDVIFVKPLALFVSMFLLACFAIFKDKSFVVVCCYWSFIWWHLHCCFGCLIRGLTSFGLFVVGFFSDCTRSAFSVYATVFSGYSFSCMVVLELLLLLELPWLVVLAQLLCFLMLCLLACLLLFYLHSFPAIVKIMEFVFFFPCFVLSLFFFPLLLVFLHQSFDVIFSRLLLSLFSMLCSHSFPPLQLFALHVIWFYSVSNTLNNSYFFCLSVGITLFARLCFGLLTHLLCHFQSWSVYDV